MNLQAYTVSQFVSNFGVSRALLYKLWSKAEGPNSYHVGRKRFISAEAAKRWMRGLENSRGERCSTFYNGIQLEAHTKQPDTR